jgi:hypothetical protein
LIDLRVSDVREAVALGTWGALKDRIVSIEKLNLLVIAPDFLQMRAASPPLRYIRLLESNAWEHYLGQSPNVSRRRRLIIYHWKNERPVTVNAPFLAFLDLSRDYGFLRFENHVREALVIVLIAAGLQAYGRGMGSELWTRTARIAGENKLASTIGGLGIFGLVFGVVKNWPVLRFVAGGCRAGFLATEKWFLKAKRR